MSAGQISTDSSYRVRLAKHNDRDSFLRLWGLMSAEIIKKGHGQVEIETRLIQAAYLFDAYWQNTIRGVALLAVEGDIPVGMTLIGHETPDGAEYGEVFGVYVLPEHRQKGIAEGILNIGIEAVRHHGIKNLRAQILVTNKESLAAANAVGFKAKSFIVVRHGA